MNIFYNLHNLQFTGLGELYILLKYKCNVSCCMYSASSSTPILYYNPSPKELSLSNVLNFILFQLNIYFRKGASLRGELNIVGRQGTQQSDRYVNIQS